MKTHNAYILDWTMNEYEQLKSRLSETEFAWCVDEGKAHARVAVPYPRVEEFAQIIQQHLNAPQNYVDVQFPYEQVTAVIFRDKVAMITTPEENENARAWAMSIGLPGEQADWSVSFSN